MRRRIHRIRSEYPGWLTPDRLHDLHWAFCDQRNSAHERGIAFALSWQQWLCIWIESGHLHERGRKRGQYVMARIGDRGPYSVNNVKIILASQNSSEGNIGKRLSAETRAKISRALQGKIVSDETRMRMSHAWINRRLAYRVEARA